MESLFSLQLNTKDYGNCSTNLNEKTDVFAAKSLVVGSGLGWNFVKVPDVFGVLDGVDPLFIVAGDDDLVSNFAQRSGHMQGLRFGLELSQ